ncbi:MAG TPA: tetratricopeptide repeat protein [Paraprevotella xylaniphila]|jgi:tetratricopeptide (TPR) repeat protein|uniref:Tetratricopeptide repeat protein n=1 Tax=Paraprevotella xylaniphila YIT 11841 TaxID=762982 RepID=F3QR71_9BACT|nr:serine protease [Paraprevotella xylaniphila]EGG56325.1 tetratricopeptide repeat protein [Paraprevotella xylaniphila YIT 11841]HAC43214.1 tetratricopeptide repeat protein [Paraprevotella xylaniphila]
MKKIIFILTCLSTLGSHLVAQNPKWFKKAAKAQISIVTMNEKGDMLQSGSGFFIGKDGTALADYQLFKQASKAKVVSGEGKEYEVEAIIGASSLYDLVKFRVKTDKDTPALTISDRMGVKHEHVYVLPYPTKENKMCVNDTLHDIQKFNEKYGYYTLGRPLDEKYLNSPVMDEEGEVLGMIQRKADASATTSYAVSVAYGNTLCTDGMSSADNDLNAIRIRKALPADEADIRTFLFMTASRSDSATYSQYLNDYILQFPKSSEAYTQRADFYMAHGNYAAAEEDMKSALEVTEKKDETYYAFSKLLYELNLKPGYQVYKDWNLNHSLTLAEEAYKANPLPLYILQEGNTLYALKEYEKACEKYLSLRETNMRSAQIFLYAAQCKRMAKTDTLQILALQDSAVACFKKPYPKDAAPSLLERSNTLLELGRYREAIADLNEYEHLMSNELTAYFYYRREQAEMQCRMFQQAVDDIDRAIRMEPKEPLYHAERAVVYYRLGEFEEALKSAQKSAELNPKFGDAYRLAGICQLRLNQREKGLSNLKKAIELGDESAQAILAEETQP